MSVAQAGLTFAIGASIGAAFKSTLSSANASISKIADEVKKLNTTKLNLQDYKLLSNLGQEGSEAFKKLTTELKRSKINLNDIDGEIARLNKNIKATTRQKWTLQFTSNAAEMKKKFIGLTTTLAAGTATVVTASLPVLEFEKAKGQIASLGISETGIDKIAKAAKEFSSEFAGTTAPDFIRASYDIKSGISGLTDEGVANFTTLAAKTAKATLSTTAEMTKMYALGYGVFRNQFKTDEEFGSQFSTAVSYAVQGFRTTGSDLSGSVSALGAVAVSKGVSMVEQFAVIGKLKDTFNSASEAAIGFKGFLNGVGKAQDSLGLKFTDAQGKMLPTVEILEKIKKKYGDTLSTVKVQDELKQAFGSDEAVKVVNGLINKTTSLKDAELALNKAIKEGTLTNEMAKANSRGEELELIKQQMQLLAIEVGEVLLPYLKQLFGYFSSAVKTVMEFITINPNLVKGIALIATGIFGVVAGYKAFTLAVSFAKVAQAAFNLVMLANPIGLIIAGILALVAVGIYFYKNWDEAKKAVVSIWGDIKDVFSSSVDFISKLFWKAINFWLLPFKLLTVAINKVKKALGMDIGDGETSFTAELKKTFSWDEPKKDTTIGKFKTSSAITQLKEVNQAKMRSNSNQTANLTFNPQITIQGNADKAVIEQALDSKKTDFEKMYEEMMTNKKRVEFAQ